ncbi:DUF4335 domain-containing protein [Lusitaniella coriacea]|uniref:DUF4335 domain-containing protein n=1 Tax=Lusitaniella coriacea TaxID=1983105 RepID=UPI003CF4AB16
MFFSPTAIRRYTPPTCTLKIVGKTSPLSRWSSQVLFKDVRFELDFDDPRQVEEDRVSIAGNREQLESLSEVVETYVQDFLLYSSPSRLSSLSSFLGSALPVESSPQSAVALSPQEEALEEEQKPKLLSPNPSLKPQGLLAHQLSFGNLATPDSGTSIQLSTIQLFDLATALEEYSTEMAVLPATGSASARRPVPQWASAAAAVLLAVGVTATVMKLNQQPQTVSSTADEELIAADDPAIAPLATPSTALDTPVPSPTTPDAISSAKRLPPPPPVGSPNIPVTPPNTNPSPVIIRPQQQRAAPQTQQKRALPPQPKVPVNRAPAPASRPRTVPPRSSAPPAPPPAPAPTPRLPNLPSLGDSGDRVTASAPENASPPQSPDFRERESLESSGTVSQVGEVKNYFQQRWKPPESLSQTLEYDLLLDRDGSIERLIPIGEAAGTFLDRTPMPLLGEPFVSNVEGRGKPKIRLMLHPNGNVETRLQSLD